MRFRLPGAVTLLVRATVVAVLACWLSAAGPLDGVQAEEWPGWRGPRGDGSWNAPPLPEQWPETSLPVAWRQPIGPGYSGVAVADGRVYTMDRPAKPADSERVVCYDAATGRLVWQYSYTADYDDLSYGKGPRTTPTIYAGRVYTLGAVGHLHCLDAATGQLHWAKDLVRDERAQQPMWGFSAAPVIYENVVIIHAGLQPGGCYVALDRRTGEEVWRAGDDPTGYGTPIIIEHAGEKQLIGWTPEHVVSLALDTGRENWRVPYKVTYGVSIATPIFREDTVLVCGYWEGSKAIQLGPQVSEATLLWEENRYLRGLMSQPLYRDGYVYLLDKQHGLVCFELSSGEVRWTDKNRLTPRGRNPQANLVWLGDSERAIALNSEGELILVRLTPEGYQEQSRVRIVGETWAHPAFAGPFVFARDDEQLVCVRVTLNVEH